MIQYTHSTDNSILIWRTTFHREFTVKIPGSCFLGLVRLRKSDIRSSLLSNPNKVYVLTNSILGIWTHWQLVNKYCCSRPVKLFWMYSQSLNSLHYLYANIHNVERLQMDNFGNWRWSLFFYSLTGTLNSRSTQMSGDFKKRSKLENVQLCIPRMDRRWQSHSPLKRSNFTTTDVYLLVLTPSLVSSNL